MATPAQEYGMVLGTLKKNIETMFRQIQEGFSIGYKPPSRLTPEELEARRERQYRAQIQYERGLGREYVTRRANEIRKELGLPRL
jgi:hypothetical protein